MDKLITLFNHTNHNEEIQIVDEILIILRSCSENSVTIYTQLNITNYEKTLTTKRFDAELTDESDFITLDFKQKNIQETEVNGKPYKIKLLNIKKEIFEGKETLFSKLLISY